MNERNTTRASGVWVVVGLLALVLLVSACGLVDSPAGILSPGEILVHLSAEAHYFDPH